MQLENTFNEASSNVAMGAQGAVGILEIGLGLHPEQIRQAEQRAAVTAENLNRTMTEALNVGHFQSGLSNDFVSNFMATAFDLAQSNPELTSDIEAFTHHVFQSMDQGLRSSATGAFDPFAFNSAERQETVQALAQMAVEVDEITAAERELAEQAERVAAAQFDNEMAVDRLNTQMDIALGMARDRHSIMQLENIEAEALATAFEHIGEVGEELPDFMTDEQATAIAAAADEATRIADEMERLDKETPDLFSDAEIDAARATADAMGDMATEAEKAAKALENISLSDVFGQGEIGLRGELTDLVLENVGFDPNGEEYAALERELSLSSGRETTGSLFLSEVIAPEIASAAEDPELAARMVERVDAILQQAVLQGLDTNSPEFLGGLAEEIDTEGGLMGVDPEAFTTSMAQGETSMDAMAESAPVVDESMEGMSVSAASIETALGGAADHSQAIKSNLAGLVGQTHVIRVRLDVEVVGDDIEGLVANAVRNNGGSTPGEVN